MKSQIRQRLLDLKKYIKLSTLAKEYGLQQATLSLFMNGSDGVVSYDNISGFLTFVEDALQDLIG